ncbi:MAG TPA: PAS domain S-box protein [Deltaproteobacteria bacterium]|nr:PAS domain S-box protein [Deltaproteobacteria bacterium]HPR53714.1 PAS domain S-box protein [Deltaproteobacteria bacterium]HXK47580.1 PAS domain S-box protein [Deltaproteobacteria bacterium]
MTAGRHPSKTGRTPRKDRSGPDAHGEPEMQVQNRLTPSILSCLLQELPVAVVLCRDDGAIYDCNDLACRMFGYTRAEMQSLQHLDLLPSIFLGIAPSYFAHETTGGEFIWVSRRRKDGTVFQCEQSSKVITADDTVFHLTCYRSSEPMGASAEKPFKGPPLDKALTLDNPFCVQTWQEINGELRLIGFNPTLEGYTDGKIREYTGRTVHELYEARGRTDAVELIYETYRSRGMTRMETTCDFLNPGTVKQLDTISFFVPPNMLVQYLEDISEQRQALTALKESEERFRALYLGSPVPVVTWRYTNNDFVLIEYNYALDAFTGGKAYELLGASSSLVFKTNPDIRQDMLRCYEEKGIVQRQTAFRTMLSDDEKHLSITHAYVPNDLVMTHIHDITDRKKAEDELVRYQQELSNLYEKHLDILERERQRIAQELHDGIGQYLSTIKVSTENILVNSARHQGRLNIEEQLRANVALLKEAIMDVSRVSMDLRPSILDDLGIMATINWFLREFGRVYRSIRVEKRIDCDDADIPQHLKIVIFRVLQESMNNIARHSGADRVLITIHRSEDTLSYSISDNGKGFDLGSMQKNRSGLGIAGMRERVAFSRGRFAVESAPQKGTVIRVTWPLDFSD